MLGIFADAMRIATRNDVKDSAKTDRDRRFHRQAAKENDETFHQRMRHGAGDKEQGLYGRRKR